MMGMLFRQEGVVMPAKRHIDFENLFNRAVKNYRYRFEELQDGTHRVTITQLEGNDDEVIESATREVLLRLMEAKGYRRIGTDIAFEIDDAP